MNRLPTFVALAVLALLAGRCAWAADPPATTTEPPKDECAEFKVDPNYKEVTEQERTKLRDLQGACRVAQGDAAIKYLEIGSGPCTQSKELREKVEKASKYATCRTKAQTDQQKKIGELCGKYEGDGVQKDAAGKFMPTGDAQRDKRVAQCAALRDEINKKDSPGMDVSACQKAVGNAEAKNDPAHPANSFCDDVFSKNEAETTKKFTQACADAGNNPRAEPCRALEAHKKDVATRESDKAAREREAALHAKIDALTKKVDELETKGAKPTPPGQLKGTDAAALSSKIATTFPANPNGYTNSAERQRLENVLAQNPKLRDQFIKDSNCSGPTAIACMEAARTKYAPYTTGQPPEMPTAPKDRRDRAAVAKYNAQRKAYDEQRAAIATACQNYAKTPAIATGSEYEFQSLCRNMNTPRSQAKAVPSPQMLNP